MAKQILIKKDKKKAELTIYQKILLKQSQLARANGRERMAQKLEKLAEIER